MLIDGSSWKGSGNIVIRAIHGNCLFDTVLRVYLKSPRAANTRYLAVYNRLERGLYHWNDYRSPMFNRTFGKLIWSERPYFPIKQTRYDISSVALSLNIILVQNLRMVKWEKIEFELDRLLFYSAFGILESFKLITLLNLCQFFKF